MHKVRLSVLWLFTAIYTVVGVVLSIMEPGVLQHLIETGELNGTKLGPEVLLVLAVFFLIPLIMAFLSVTLKDKANRWANVIAGIAFIVIASPDLIKYLVPEKYYLLFGTSITIIVYLLIIWYAYKWPKQKE